jgi:hypothetical protein
VEARIDNGQLEILSYEDWYLVDGRFDGQVVLNAASEKCQNAISNGYSGLRVAGSTYWLDGNGWDSFMDFEETINSSITDKKCLVVCSYKNSKCAKDKIADVINNHKYVLCKSKDSWRLKKPDL